MRTHTLKADPFQLAAALTLLLILPMGAVLAAAPKGTASPAPVKPVPTRISLHPEGTKLVLEVRPSPTQLELFSGVRRLARMPGNQRTRFDITRYAAQCRDGRMRILVVDRQGGRHSRILNVSAHKPSPTAPPVAGAPATKVDNFLRELMKARSPDAVAQAFHRAHFSAAEKRQLERTLREPRYAAKLRTLGNRRKGPLPATARPPRLNPRLTQMRQRSLAQHQAQQLRRLNQQAETLFRRLQGGGGTGTMAAARPRAVPLTPAMQARMNARPTPGGDHDWRISSVEPTPVEAGRAFNIHGSGFGSAGGTVDLVFTDLRSIVPLTVGSWSDTRVTVTVPSDASPLLGDSGRTGRLWVKPRDGGGSGPTANVTVRPDPRTLEPTITVLSSDTVMPGQELTIGGRNFLDHPRGTVEFRFGAHRFNGEIQRWDNDVIRVRLPEDISGMVTTAGEVVIENNVRAQAAHAITFRPRINSVVLTDTEGHVCWGLLGYKEYIQLWNNPLINEWKVVATERHKYNSTIFSGCEFERQPTAGSTNATTEIMLWCDAFSWLSCDVNLTLEGPEGTPHGAGGRRSSPVPFR